MELESRFSDVGILITRPDACFRSPPIQYKKNRELEVKVRLVRDEVKGRMSPRVRVGFKKRLRIYIPCIPCVS